VRKVEGGLTKIIGFPAKLDVYEIIGTYTFETLSNLQLFAKHDLIQQ